MNSRIGDNHIDLLVFTLHVIGDMPKSGNIANVGTHGLSATAVCLDLPDGFVQLLGIDKYRLIILDDIVYVSKDQTETSGLFELIGSRYERLSLLITANQPFGEVRARVSSLAQSLESSRRLQPASRGQHGRSDT